MKIACLFKGNLRHEDRTKENFNLVKNNVSNILFPEYNIDFFMHLWSDNPTEELKLYMNHFNSNCLLLEKNSDYFDDITNISKNKTTPGAFAQISSSLSIKKVCKLFLNYCKENNKSYDFIFISRPDMVSVETFQYNVMTDDVIYVNKHGNNIYAGDYCWLMKPVNVNIFANIFDFLKENTEFSVAMHYWLYDYLHNFAKKTIIPCNLDVGVNCEIFKHLHLYPNISSKIYSI